MRVLFLLCSPAEQAPNHSARVESDCRGNIKKFEHVEAPVSALIFGNVRRRLAQALRDNSLRQACCFALGL
jgi:hypothetical protein